MLVNSGNAILSYFYFIIRIINIAVENTSDAYVHLDGFKNYLIINSIVPIQVMHNIVKGLYEIRNLYAEPQQQFN